MTKPKPKPPEPKPPKPRLPPKETFHLVVACPSERAQRELFERLAREGWKCRVITP